MMFSTQLLLQPRSPLVYCHGRWHPALQCRADMQVPLWLSWCDYGASAPTPLRGNIKPLRSYSGVWLTRSTLSLTECRAAYRLVFRTAAEDLRLNAEADAEADTTS